MDSGGCSERGGDMLRCMTFCRSLGAMVLFFSFLPSVYAASFPCTKSITDVEKMICDDYQLSMYDEELNYTYNKALKVVGNELIKQQREWIKKIRNNCDNVDCLRKAYRSRAVDLMQAAMQYDSSFTLYDFPVMTTTKQEKVCSDIININNNGKLMSIVFDIKSFNMKESERISALLSLKNTIPKKYCEIINKFTGANIEYVEVGTLGTCSSNMIYGYDFSKISSDNVKKYFKYYDYGMPWVADDVPKSSDYTNLDDYSDMLRWESMGAVQRIIKLHDDTYIVTIYTKDQTLFSAYWINGGLKRPLCSFRPTAIAVDISQEKDGVCSLLAHDLEGKNNSNCDQSDNVMHLGKDRKLHKLSWNHESMFNLLDDNIEINSNSNCNQSVDTNPLDGAHQLHEISWRHDNIFNKLDESTQQKIRDHFLSHEPDEELIADIDINNDGENEFVIQFVHYFSGGCGGTLSYICIIDIGTMKQVTSNLDIFNEDPSWFDTVHIYKYNNKTYILAPGRGSEYRVLIIDGDRTSEICALKKRSMISIDTIFPLE